MGTEKEVLTKSAKEDAIAANIFMTAVPPRLPIFGNRNIPEKRYRLLRLYLVSGTKQVTGENLPPGEGFPCWVRSGFLAVWASITCSHVAVPTCSVRATRRHSDATTF